MMLFADSPTLAPDPSLESTFRTESTGHRWIEDNATASADCYQDWPVGLTLGTGLPTAAVQRTHPAIWRTGQPRGWPQ